MGNDLIHLLPDSVANQIAAGEVIQRPASVVKELVENSVDAGARTIHLLLTDAGRTNIQVIDDGKGMSETDARMSFERHATSKITQPADLFALHTFGFRGEALASIAAVAQVELRTRREEDELGTVIHIAGSKVERQEVEMCPAGTNFQVKNLFFNVPARRKFLKSNQTELNNILAEMERIALVNPEIEFVVHHNGVELMHLVQSGTRQRIQQLFGKKVGQELLPIDIETTLVSIKGYVGLPESARKKGANMFFFVNGRFMRHPYFHKSVMEAYARLIPPTEQVPYFLYFTVDPTRIDVNIHPTKTEIKFEDEQAIWQILMASVRETLGRSNAAPSIDFDTADCPDIPVPVSAENLIRPPMPSVDATYNPFRQTEEKEYKRTVVGWEDLYGGGRKTRTPEEIPYDMPERTIWTNEEEDTRAVEQAEPLFVTEEMTGGSVDCHQYKGRYIVASSAEGLLFIDQHRAHTRVLYERYMRQFVSSCGVSQGLLFPEMLSVTVSQGVVMEQLLDDFACLGFDISNMGGGTFAVQGIPAGIEGLKYERLILEMLQEAAEKGTFSKEEVHQALARTMARSAAVVVGQVLSEEEMKSLVSDLFACEMPAYTPAGKKVYVMIGDAEMDRWLC